MNIYELQIIKQKLMGVLHIFLLKYLFFWLKDCSVDLLFADGALKGVLPFFFRGRSVRSWCDGSSDRSFMVDPLSYFSFQPVLHDWCTKGRGMCYPVCGMVHIKERLLLIEKNSPCGGSGFPLPLSEWSFTICPTPYNRK